MSKPMSTRIGNIIRERFYMAVSLKSGAAFCLGLKPSVKWCIIFAKEMIRSEE